MKWSKKMECQKEENRRKVVEDEEQAMWNEENENGLRAETLLVGEYIFIIM